jgi:hypothetical protein
MNRACHWLDSLLILGYTMVGWCDQPPVFDWLRKKVGSGARAVWLVNADRWQLAG